MDEASSRSYGLEWEPALANGFMHDGGVYTIAHPNGFRDATVIMRAPWHWDLRKVPLPTGVAYEQVASLRFIFQFRDVARFGLTHRLNEQQCVNVEDGTVSNISSTDLHSPHVSRQAIYGYAEFDDEKSIEDASRLHGGDFRSVLIHLFGGAPDIDIVFRDCLCTPSDWAAYEAWATYTDMPYPVPPRRSTPLETAGRYVLDYRRHVCSTKITSISSSSPEVDEQYLCEDCIEEWFEGYAHDAEIPRTPSGTGALRPLYGDQRTWERGRFPNQKCFCMIERPID